LFILLIELFTNKSAVIKSLTKFYIRNIRKDIQIIFQIIRALIFFFLVKTNKLAFSFTDILYSVCYSVLAKWKMEKVRKNGKKGLISLVIFFNLFSAFIMLRFMYFRRQVHFLADVMYVGESYGQFHQHFMSKFFVRMLFWQFFLSYKAKM